MNFRICKSEWWNYVHGPQLVFSVHRFGNSCCIIGVQRCMFHFCGFATFQVFISIVSFSHQLKLVFFPSQNQSLLFSYSFFQFIFFLIKFYSDKINRSIILNNKIKTYIEVLFRYKENELLLLVSAKLQYIHCQGYILVTFLWRIFFFSIIRLCLISCVK